jgi:hypothetical protein
MSGFLRFFSAFAVLTGKLKKLFSISLNKGNCPSFRLFAGKACFVHNVRGNGAVNNLHHLA